MIASLPTIVEAHALMRRGRLTPLDLVDFCLERTARLEPSVRAWVLLDAEQARRQARQQTEWLAEQRAAMTPAATGEHIRLPPLFGIPLGVKDIIDVAGQPTLAGSALRSDQPAAADAPVVARLREQGALILGKTVTTEFACFDPPPTGNPWNLARTPGGSSSGSAAAVCAGMCLAAVGSQTGGSILRPASFCGVAGLKPSHGAVPAEQVVPIRDVLDHVGPIGRRVVDLAVLYFVMAGQSNRASDECVRRCVEASDPGVRFVRVGEFYDERAEPDVLSVTLDAVARLASHRPAGGFPIRPLPASFAELHQHHRVLMAVGMARQHGPHYEGRPADFGQHVGALIRAGLETSTPVHDQAQRHHARFRDEIDRWLSPGTIALMPTTRTTAPNRDSTGDPSFQAVWSYAGLPSLTIPCGRGRDGMPLGLQLVAGRGREAELLAAAAWCERLLGTLDWESTDSTASQRASTSAAHHIALRSEWQTEAMADGTWRLRRSFGTPTNLSPTTTVSLVLGPAPAPVAVTLNRTETTHVAPGTTPRLDVTGRLLSRNEVVIACDANAATADMLCQMTSDARLEIRELNDDAGR